MTAAVYYLLFSYFSLENKFNINRHFDPFIYSYKRLKFKLMF